MFSKDTLKYEAVPLPKRDPMGDADSLAAARSFLETMKARHTIRDFADTPVARDVIEACIAAAGRAPSGANHQPWHFVAVADPAIKQQIRFAAEAEERNFYGGSAGDEWIKALEPIGTGPDKPHLEVAPWLIMVFAQRWGEFDN
ncbi:MAG: nitroreductase family protein, partial [Pseudomonadota bacterium]